jgi:cardiolipin synthase
MTLPSLNWSVLYLVSEWAIRLVMLVYVPQKRTAAGARAWLLLIFFWPLPGLILYSLMGRIYVSRRRLALQRLSSQRIRSVQAGLLPPAAAGPVTLPAHVQAAAQLVAQLGDFVAIGGNRLELLPGYEEPLRRLTDDLEAARHSIHFLYYIFEDDAVGNRVADVLMRAAKRGVEVRVLMDAAGSRRGLRRLAPRLRAAGIVVHEMLPVGLFRRNVARFDLRNHRKIAVIDGELAYTGSQNIVDPEFIPGCPNEELVVRLTGPAVIQLQGVFLADWYLETSEAPAASAALNEPDVAGTTIAQVLPSGPGYGRENTKELMIAMIYAARREVTIVTPYFVPPDAFLEALVAAARRGVNTRLILPRRSNQRVTDYAQQSYYSQLLAAGITIYLYEGRFLHAKHMTVDDEVALIGSTNMDIRSFALNAEVSLLAYDRDVVARLHQICDGYREHAVMLEARLWSARPLPQRLFQNIARLADSLL